VWIDGEEVADVYARFRDVRLTREPAIEISGPSGVPLMLAMAAGKDWRGHMPGPNGLPGGYPVKFAAGRLGLDMPGSLTRDEAIAWNLSYEEESGLVVGADGRATYTGVLRGRLAVFSADIANGFDVRHLSDACRAMTDLRSRLQVRSP
jgi:hypothetical protein